MGAGVDGDRRILAIDWMRGFVMVLMAIDHASETWNADRFNADSAYLLDPGTGLPVFMPGTVIPAVDFLTRWITHLCAPTFLFLSGTSLALSVEKRARAGEAPGTLDRHLFVRALVILALEGCLSLMAGMGILLLQVLFAIGVSLLVMIPLRRLGTFWLVGAALLWFVGGEGVTRGLVPIGSTDIAPLPLLTLAPAYASPIVSIYPFVHWLAMMMLGWGFGRFLLAQPAGPGRARYAPVGHTCQITTYRWWRKGGFFSLSPIAHVGDVSVAEPSGALHGDGLAPTYDDRWAACANGFGLDIDLAEGVELAFVRGGTFGPKLAQDLDGFVRAGPALRDWRCDGLELGRKFASDPHA